jgi:hypothetical protein
MMSIAGYRMTAIGAAFVLVGLVSKTLELPVPDWLACVSLAIGLIAIIFASGRRVAGNLPK